MLRIWLALLLFWGSVSSAGQLDAIRGQFEPMRNPDWNGGTSPLTSTNVQSAIEEAYYQAIGKLARYSVVFGLSGTKSNAWLQIFNNITSDASPYIVAEPSTIKALSVAASTIDTAIYTVYVNSAPQLTLTRTASKTAYQSGFNYALVAGDEISVAITSGTSKDTAFSVKIQTPTL